MESKPQMGKEFQLEKTISTGERNLLRKMRLYSWLPFPCNPLDFTIKFRACDSFIFSWDIKGIKDDFDVFIVDFPHYLLSA